MQKRMVILVGLPGSGKTTCALSEYASEQWKRISYDDLRWLDAEGKPKDYVYNSQNEKLIKARAEQIAINAALDGQDLVIDNTNLSASAMNRWCSHAFDFHMKVEVVPFDTPLAECVRRDDLRDGPRKVGRAVIERLALFTGRVIWPADQQIVIVDMDGTIADCSHRFYFIDAASNIKKYWHGFFSACGEDAPIKPVVQWVRSLKGKYLVCIVSGRPVDECGKLTVAWLAKYEVPYDHLFMRAGGDHRPDTIIKGEIVSMFPKDTGFDTPNIHPQIAFAIDDRPSVIRMWESRGIKVFDVGAGVEF
jgi:predicted kinase